MASNHYSPKSILEEALHKANNAVFFDYRQNFEDAIRAYGQAYSLMGQVVRVSLSDDDRRKLEAIVGSSSCIEYLGY